MIRLTEHLLVQANLRERKAKMIYHPKELDRNISFLLLQNVLPFVFLLLFLHPGIVTGREAAADQVLGMPASTRNETGDTKADFLFKKPKHFLGFRIGGFFPRADSGVFDMITRELTLEKSDFRAWDIAVDIGSNIHQKVDLLFSLDYSKQTENSEFREFIDEQGLPITQTTSYLQVPMTVGIKFLLVPRGR
jgi:hypothetical protein